MLCAKSGATMSIGCINSLPDFLVLSQARPLVHLCTMRTIRNIVIHCTASSPDATLADLQAYWRSIGWRRPGYHRLVMRDGTVEALADYAQLTNGVAGHNADSIHIAYLGGIDAKLKPRDTRTGPQRETLARLIKEARALFPQARILGHRDFPGVAKACPSFDVTTWLKGKL